PAGMPKPWSSRGGPAWSDALAPRRDRRRVADREPIREHHPPILSLQRVPNQRRPCRGSGRVRAAAGRGIASRERPFDNARMREIGIEQLIESLREVLGARPEIQEAYLFGSRARGHAGAHNDVDVAVYLDLGRVP